MKSYAISAFCIHNTREIVALPKEFYECYRHIKRLWKQYLPIQTTCIRITRFNLSAYMTRVRERYAKYRRGGEFGTPRAKDVFQIIEELDMSALTDSAI